MGNNSGLRGCFSEVTTGCLGNVLGALTLSIIAVVAVRFGISLSDSQDINITIVFPTAAPGFTASAPPPPTDFPAPTPLFLPTSSIEDLGLTPVAQNADWMPVSRDFDGITMVLVPAGCFMMGNDDGDNDEMPIHQQCFEQPFWIDQYEVTNAQFERFNGQARKQSYALGNDRPRENISWEEATRFCAVRGKRLPTEPEWEYAARGPDNLTFPWGYQFDPGRVMSNSNSSRDVGSYALGVSWVGALDMSGNVWEWTSSVYAPYPYHEAAAHAQSLRVYRGGSFKNQSYYLTTSYRGGLESGESNNNIGFRCAL